MTIAAILALAVVAFAAGAYAYLVYSPKPQMPSLSTEVQHATMRVGDRERSYLAYVPARLPSGAALVIVLHGSGMDGAKMRAWTGYEFDGADRDFRMSSDVYEFRYGSVIHKSISIETSQSSW